MGWQSAEPIQADSHLPVPSGLFMAFMLSPSSPSLWSKRSLGTLEGTCLFSREKAVSMQGAMEGWEGTGIWGRCGGELVCCLLLCGVMVVFSVHWPAIRSQMVTICRGLEQESPFVVTLL